MTDVTQILSKIEQGDSSAEKLLLPLVYNELWKLAAMKLFQEMPFAAAAEAMRRILVEYARRNNA